MTNPKRKAAPGAAHLRQELRDCLAAVSAFESCALLDYPDHFNIGDHVIWLGTVRWLTQTRGAEIRYVSGAYNFSESQMKKSLGPGGAIVFSGGGNLGDVFSDHQKFREQVISRCKDRPVVIMPQSVFFTSRQALQKAKNVFNSHPNLTIFLRDNLSYRTALEAFDRCRVFRSPDIAFELADLDMIRCALNPPNERNGVLYLSRHDVKGEVIVKACRRFWPGTVQSDWITKNEQTRFLQKINRHLPFLSKFPRSPRERALRSASLFRLGRPFREQIRPLVGSRLHRHSLDLVLIGIHQIRRHSFIVTNRLHGHILSVMMGLPHVLLPNPHSPKNTAFYFSWTRRIRHCKYVSKIAKLGQAAQKAGFIA